MAPHEQAKTAVALPSVDAFVSDLEDWSARKDTKIKCRKTSFAVEGASPADVHGGARKWQIDSWKFNEWDYKKEGLPCYARGLFTTRSTSDGHAEIVVRGYDKFFNIGEVRDTQWENIFRETSGPYELSLKENGCIIFLAGLEDGTLLVCSKHSIGARVDTDLSHAQAGERRLDLQLQKLGKTRRELAMELRHRNQTAVAELCDDSFEEHVLAYAEDDAGLYLHGLNVNVPIFTTMSSDVVSDFAKSWGFRSTEYLVMDDVKEVRALLSECEQTGSWGDRPVEGFVVRCRRSDVRSEHPDWFFKYKFEEPYLMYRGWREATRAMIAGKPVRNGKHKKITEEYLAFARKQFAKDPTLKAAFNQSHGIIAMRDGFLRENASSPIELARLDEDVDPDSISAIVLAPIATLGCGKTTIASALELLLGAGHVQNDDLAFGKGKPQQFAKLVLQELQTHNVVIADRNNHQFREREQLLRDVRPGFSKCHFIALYWNHGGRAQTEDIRKITEDRVFSRGDNHQTIKSRTKDAKEIKSIMAGFINRFEPWNPETEPDCLFDDMIELDPLAESRSNLGKVVDFLHQKYPAIVPELPTDEALDEAIDSSISKTITQKDLSLPRRTNKFAEPEYFAIKLPKAEILGLLTEDFRDQPSKAEFFKTLSTADRVQDSFHVTMIHQESKKANPEEWSTYLKLLEKTKSAKANKRMDLSTMSMGAYHIRITRVVWDSRVMCCEVEVSAVGDGLPACFIEHPHTTIGTLSPDIKPYESNVLLKRMNAPPNGHEEINSIQLSKPVEMERQLSAVMARSWRDRR